MNRDEIIRMARESGWSGIYTQWAEPTGKPDWKPVKESLTVPVTMEQIERFASLVAAAEREACARVCDELIADTPDNDPDKDAIGACADAIRARSNP